MGVQPQVTLIEPLVNYSLSYPFAITSGSLSSLAAKRQRVASSASEGAGGENPEVILERGRPAAPAILNSNSDSDLMSTGAARTVPVGFLLAEGPSHSFPEAAEENPPRALAWEECCCSNQLKRLTLHEVEML